MWGLKTDGNKISNVIDMLKNERINLQKDYISMKASFSKLSDYAQESGCVLSINLPDILPCDDYVFEQIERELKRNEGKESVYLLESLVEIFSLVKKWRFVDDAFRMVDNLNFIAQKDYALRAELKSIDLTISNLILKKKSLSEEFLEIESKKNSESEEKVRYDMRSKVLKDYESDFLEKFNILERVLLQFKKVSYENNDLLDSYLENPLKALSRDSSLKIVRLLGRLKREIGDGNIHSDKEIISLIINMDNIYFENFINKRAELIAKKREAESVFLGSSLIQREIKVKHMLQAVNLNLKEKTLKRPELVRQIASLGFRQEKKRLETKFSSIFSKSISLE